MSRLWSHEANMWRLSLTDWDIWGLVLVNTEWRKYWTTSLMKSSFANKARCANTPKQTALMIVNTWHLCLNSWSLDSRMGESFVTRSQNTLLYSPPPLLLTVKTFHSNHWQHRADRVREHSRFTHIWTQKHRFTSSRMYLYHSGMWPQNEHCSESQAPSLPLSLCPPPHLLLSSSRPTPEQEHSWTRNNVCVWGGTSPSLVYLWLCPPITNV